MYTFRLKFRNIYTLKVLYRRITIDTCMWSYKDICSFGFETFDEYAWSQAVCHGNKMFDDESIELEGITIISK